MSDAPENHVSSEQRSEAPVSHSGIQRRERKLSTFKTQKIHTCIALLQPTKDDAAKHRNAVVCPAVWGRHAGERPRLLHPRGTTHDAGASLVDFATELFFSLGDCMDGVAQKFFLTRGGDFMGEALIQPCGRDNHAFLA